MFSSKTNSIKVLIRHREKSPTENLAYATAVHSGIYGDPADYTDPPVDEPTFKTAIDGLSATVAAALDGGRQAIAERNRQEAVVVKMMAELGRYVEGACNNDMPTFLKSGFQPKSTPKAAKPQLTQWIRKITPGANSGQLRLTLVAIAGAAAYEVQYAPTVNGTPAAWLSQLITKTRPATTLTGLTPGATYTFHVRSFKDATGYSDWSDPVTRIVT